MCKRHIGSLWFQRVTHGEHNTFTIVRVDEREQFILRAVDQSRRHTEQRINHWRPAEMSSLDVPTPKPYPYGSQGDTAFRITGTESIFDPFPLGNVGGDAASRIGRACMVAKREFD